jgi:hypothetical protein
LLQSGALVDQSFDVAGAFSSTAGAGLSQADPDPPDQLCGSCVSSAAGGGGDHDCAGGEGSGSGGAAGSGAE